MKRRIAMVIAIVMLSLGGAVLAETGSWLFDVTDLDWFSMWAAEQAEVPAELTEREAEIYLAGYANGHHDALHPAYMEGTYVLNTKTKKYHLTNCMTTLMITSDNREFSTLSPEQLKEKGYKPCGQCFPKE